jgi:hypothetical protein
MISATYIQTMNAFSERSNTTIADEWRCHALEPGGERRDARRCERGGVRYRGPHWVCLRHYDEAASDTLTR